jgi:hypothetical protein
VFVPGTPYSQRQLREIFDRAVRESNVAMAWNVAGGIGRVELHRALALTLLLGRQGDRRYPASARRFLARFAEEAEPTLAQVRKVADALDTLARTRDLPAMREGADRALEDLGRQLRHRS